MTDLTPREARTLWGLLKIRETQFKTQLKAALTYAARFIDQDPGDKNSAKLGAARLGKVVLTEPEVRAIVTDRAAFIEWVQEVAPTEVEHIPTVRPAYETKVLEQALANGAPVDKEGREIPGVTIGQGSTPQQRFYADEGAERLLAAVEEKDLPEIDGVDLAAIFGIRRSASEIADQATQEGR